MFNGFRYAHHHFCTTKLNKQASLRLQIKKPELTNKSNLIRVEKKKLFFLTPLLETKLTAHDTRVREEPKLI